MREAEPSSEGIFRHLQQDYLLFATHDGPDYLPSVRFLSTVFGALWTFLPGFCMQVGRMTQCTGFYHGIELDMPK